MTDSSSVLNNSSILLKAIADRILSYWFQRKRMLRKNIHFHTHTHTHCYKEYLSSRKIKRKDII